MTKYILEPEVPCQLGDTTEMNSDVHPPLISKLAVVFDGWLGDDLMECFPVFLVTEKLKKSLKKDLLTGFFFDDLTVEKSDTFDEIYGDKDLPKIFWMKVSGVEDEDNFFIDEENLLNVSDKAMSLLKKHNISNCDIEEMGSL